MSHFYAAIPVSARRTTATARGHASTGIETYAASWNGRITVRLSWNKETDEDEFVVLMEPHQGYGERSVIARGIVGKAESVQRDA